MQSVFQPSDATDTTQSIFTDYSADSKVLLVAFGGLLHRLVIPVYEFLRLADKFPTKKIFVRDLNQGWYQKGIVGIARDADEFAAHLKKMIDDLAVDRVVFVGTSAGGYAALLFGCLLNVDAVLAFSPQTFIGLLPRLLCLDWRWLNRVLSVYTYRGTHRKYFELRKLLRTHKNNKTIYHLYTSEHLDTLHSLWLLGIDNIVRHIYPSKYSHAGLVHYLRNSNQLEQILFNALQLPSNDTSVAPQSREQEDITRGEK